MKTITEILNPRKQVANAVKASLAENKTLPKVIEIETEKGSFEVKLLSKTKWEDGTSRTYVSRTTRYHCELKMSINAEGDSGEQLVGGRVRLVGISTTGIASHQPY